jgi:hypothetical protein
MTIDLQPTKTLRGLKEKGFRHHGEYRTRCFVLAAWDQVDAGGELAAMGM